ncbi:MAG: carbohydrate-binding protein, partial [Prolixibacteraceae bacterium]|nr:carbohydrate-binding protein [Prolixibacteraceae bacterium]MBN2773415.1 carbohydrate-binding protein [Prolixibacteraceae bacterium]
LDTFKGWKSLLVSKDAWIQYNSVDFVKKIKKVLVSAASESGGTIEIHLDNVNGPIVSEIEIPAGEGWKTVEAKTSKIKKGIHNLIVVLKNEDPVEIDWIRFEK